MKYQFVENHRSDHEVAFLCEILKVSRSSYYRWRKKPLSSRDIWKTEITGRITELYEKYRHRYGAPRIHQLLIREGYEISLNTVADIMSRHRLFAVKKKKFKATTDSDHNLAVFPNLLNQNFKVDTPNKVWASDITYIRTKEGWLYLAVVLDLYSRKVIGWSMEKNMKKELVLKALRMALDNREVSTGLIHHSDRGSQYASRIYQQTLRSNGIISSMSRKGNCYDNAVVESFFSTLKAECCFTHGVFETRELARSNIFEYIETFYNTKRMHSYLGYLAPNEFEAM